MPDLSSTARWCAGGLLSIFGSFSCLAQDTTAVVTKEAAKVPAALPGVGQIVISLALVVGLVIFLAFLYKKIDRKSVV